VISLNPLGDKIPFKVILSPTKYICGGCMADQAKNNDSSNNDESSNVEICDFGSAPEHKRAGYKSSGLIVTGTDDEVIKLFRLSGDVRLIKSCSLNESEEHQYFVMFKD
jgi:hypothetical protein